MQYASQAKLNHKGNYSILNVCKMHISYTIFELVSIIFN